MELDTRKFPRLRNFILIYRVVSFRRGGDHNCGNSNIYAHQSQQHRHQAEQKPTSLLHYCLFFQILKSFVAESARRNQATRHSLLL
jgi:hypothetical protein